MNAAMGVTAIDLFRSGNATTPRLHRVRTTGPNADVDLYQDPASGDDWVRANGKGVSTWDSVDPTRAGVPWRLAAGSQYPNSLKVWNDDPGHWVWEPTADMKLSDYVAALEVAGQGFVKV